MFQSLPSHITRAAAVATLVFGGAAIAAPPTKHGDSLQVSTQSAQPQPQRTRRARERLICVDMAFTSSRLTRRVCHTEAEWQNEGGVPTGR